MDKAVQYKKDLPDALERLSALWEGRCMERPCIAVTAPQEKQVPKPSLPTSAEMKWLDPSWVIQDALAQLQNTWWGGEAIPSYLLLAGWVVSLGGKPNFSMDTIWFEEVPVDFGRPSAFTYDPADVWVKKFRAVYSALADAAGRDRFLVGQPCMLPASDLLSMHMGANTFLLALLDHPDWMREAIMRGARDLVRAQRELQDLIRDKHEFWYGNGGWMPFWAPEPFMSTQCDVSCMLSPRMFEEFIAPELEIAAEALGPIWYHLDGGDARQHLPKLLSLPYVRAIQYTPAPNEPCNGPAHLGLYKQIQDAGRIVYIEAPKDNIEPMVRELDPSRLMVYTSCNSIAEGNELLSCFSRRRS